MTSSNNKDQLLELIQYSIHHISRVEGIIINQHRLVDDVVALALVFNEPSEFQTSTFQVIHYMERIVDGRVKGKELSGNLSDWNSCHFQSKRENGHPADLRIIYQNIGESTVIIRGFGHRHLPSDIYKRMYGR